MTPLTVLNPVARTDRPKVPSAPRPGDLNGKTVGLFWNGKSGGDLLLAHSAELVKQRFGAVKFKNYNPQDLKSPAQFDALAKECDAVVQATGD